jgi:hypothetical protein
LLLSQWLSLLITSIYYNYYHHSQFSKLSNSPLRFISL